MEIRTAFIYLFVCFALDEGQTQQDMLVMASCFTVTSDEEEEREIDIFFLTPTCLIPEAISKSIHTFSYYSFSPVIYGGKQALNKKC